MVTDQQQNDLIWSLNISESSSVIMKEALLRLIPDLVQWDYKPDDILTSSGHCNF